MMALKSRKLRNLTALVPRQCTLVKKTKHLKAISRLIQWTNQACFARTHTTQDSLTALFRSRH